MITRWRDGIFEYKVDKDSLWMLVFEHNTTTHGFFSSKKDAEFKLERGKFSLISKLSDDSYVHRFNSSYEFLLEYPNNFTGLSNHWLQSVDPFLHPWPENDDNLYAPGFVPFGLEINSTFFGLMKDEYPVKALIDGRSNDNWHYAIGDYCKQYEPLTPGPIGTYVSSVYLWIKVRQPFFHRRTCKSSNYSISFYLSFLVITLS